MGLHQGLIPTMNSYYLCKAAVQNLGLEPVKFYSRVESVEHLRDCSGDCPIVELLVEGRIVGDVEDLCPYKLEPKDSLS